MWKETAVALLKCIQVNKIYVNKYNRTERNKMVQIKKNICSLHFRYCYVRLSQKKKVKVKFSLKQAMEAHRTAGRRSLHLAYRWRWVCQPYTPTALCPPGRFLVLISLRGWVDPRAIVRREELGKLKDSKDFIGNWTRNLPACSVAPQLTTLPRSSCQV
jgi:hypothetical protein